MNGVARAGGQLLVGAAVRTLVPNGRLVEVQGCADGAPHENRCHLLAKRLADVTPGAVVTSGWCLEGIHRNGAKVGEFRVVFDYHSLVRMPDGSLWCPGTPVGESMQFVEDPARPFDYESLAAYNLAVFANHKLVSPMGPVVPPFTMAWAAPLGDAYLYSSDRRRARWVSFAWGDPFEFAAAQGLDRASVLDMAFASDIDDVLGSVDGLRAARDGAEMLAKLRDMQPLLRREREV